MKITAMQSVLAMIFCGITMAHNNYAQLLDRKVTLNLSDVSMQQALLNIEAVTHVRFYYRVDQLQTTNHVTLHASNLSLREVLDQLLAPFSFSYNVHEKESTIILKRISTEEEIKDATPPMTVQDFIHQAFVSGRVTDALTGQPLAGVNILIKGSTSGTTTSGDGTYTIEAAADNILVFSFIGYKSQEITVGNLTSIDIALAEDIASLNEVVVNAGYYTVDDKQQTGNIARLSSEDIKTQPVSNPMQALIGRLPGVNVIQQTGMPGGAISVQIRGRNSIAKSNDPLYIIDGVPFTSSSVNSTLISSVIGGGNPLSNINPSEIESIEILKDADATAIYGSRGANGVVLISTKKGKSGRTKVDIDFSSGVGQVASHIDLLNTQQYLQMRKEAFKNDNIIPAIGNAKDLLVWDTTRYTDFQKLMIGGTAHTNNLSAAVSGGNDNTQFIIGTGLRSETTVFPGDFSDKKASVHVNLSHQSTDKRLGLQLSATYAAENNTLPSNDFTSQIYALAPNTPELYNEDGSLNWGPPNATFNNPFGILRRSYKAVSSNGISNFLLTYKILEGLQFKTSLGFNDLLMNDRQIVPRTAFNPALTATPQAYYGDNHLQTWVVEPQLNYEKTIANGKLSAIIGSTLQQSRTVGKTLYATGFTNDNVMENIAAASSIQVFNPVNNTYRYAGIFARLHYNWKEKYLVNFTARRDGSSRFGPGNQFANFGAIGAAWIFSNEEFIKNNFSVLSFAKLRASVGTTGNDQIGDYGYLDTWTATTYPYQGVSGFFPSRLYNPNYSWEINRKTEAGIETAWWNNRLTLGVSYYRNRSSSQLLGYTLPLTTGFASVQQNLPATVQNDGWEVELSGTIIERNLFSWNASLNYTRPRNTLIRYDDLDKSTYANVLEIGRPITAQKRLHATGVNTQTGLYQFEDVNGNGSDTDNPGDLVAINGPMQDFYGGITNTLTLGNVQLGFTFQYVKQTGYNYFYSNGLVPGFLGNQSTIVLDRWQQAGDETANQKFTQSFGAAGNRYFNYQASDAAFGDASFIRLKNASLSYNLKGAWMQKIRLQQCRLYIIGQNLLTFTSFRGLDPETQFNQSLPPLRTIMAGVQFTL